MLVGAGLKGSKQSGIWMCWMYMYVKAVWLSVQYSKEYKGVGLDVAGCVE